MKFWPTCTCFPWSKQKQMILFGINVHPNWAFCILFPSICITTSFFYLTLFKQVITQLSNQFWGFKYFISRNFNYISYTVPYGWYFLLIIFKMDFQNWLIEIYPNIDWNLFTCCSSFEINTNSFNSEHFIFWPLWPQKWHLSLHMSNWNKKHRLRIVLQSIKSRSKSVMVNGSEKGMSWQMCVWHTYLPWHTLLTAIDRLSVREVLLV